MAINIYDFISNPGFSGAKLKTNSKRIINIKKILSKIDEDKKDKIKKTRVS